MTSAGSCESLSPGQDDVDGIKNIAFDDMSTPQ